MPMDEELDLYKVLKVSRDANAEQIRAAWKRMAKEHHPDKHSKTNPEAAEELFKQIAFAYSVLSDPEKRRRYDMYGPEDLDLEDFDEFAAQVDPNGVGAVQKAMLTLLNKTGIEMRSAVAHKAITIENDDADNAPPLLLGGVHQDKVEKQAARLYSLTVTHEQIEGGLLVSAYSTAGSRFKVVLFEKREPNKDQWQVVAQEDSTRTGKGRLHTAGLFFMPFDTYQLGNSVVEDPESADEMEVTLFAKLRGMKRRDNMVLRPGKYVVAVYGDNWFHRSTYVLKLLSLRDSEQAATLVRDAETRLLQHRRVVQDLEQRFRQAQEQLLIAPIGFGAHQKPPQTPAQVMEMEKMERAFDDMHGEAEDARDTLEDLLENRATAYKQLLQAAAVRAPPAVGSHGRGDSVPEVNMARENSKGRRSDSASSSPRSTRSGAGPALSSFGRKLSGTLLTRKTSKCNASFVPVLCVHAPSNKSSRSTPPKATAAPLHPTPTNTCVRIRGTHGPQEYWQIADVHCSTFYGDSDQGSLLGQLLRLDRVMALNTGVRLQARQYGNFACLVAEALMDHQGSDATSDHQASGATNDVGALSNGATNDIGAFSHPRVDSWLRNVLPKETQVGYERTSQDSNILGTVVLDSLGEHVPPRRQESYGTVRFVRRQHIAYISNLAVAVEARRGGVGRALLECCEKLARAWGCHAVALHVDPSNTAAYQLYKSQGYKEVMEEPWVLRFLEGRPNVRLVMMMRTIRTLPVEPSIPTSLEQGGVTATLPRRNQGVGGN